MRDRGGPVVNIDNFPYLALGSTGGGLMETVERLSAVMSELAWTGKTGQQSAGSR